jgi:putative ABC transport system permease protein
VGSVVAFTSIGEGFRQSITDYCRSSGAQLMVYKKGVADLEMSHLKAEDIENVKRLGNVESVSRAVLVRKALSTPGLLIFGRDPNEKFIRKYEQKDELDGRLLKELDEIMLGEKLASSFNLKRDSEIDTSKLPIVTTEGLPKKFKVVGIFKTKISWENYACVVHINLAIKARGWATEDSSVIFIYLKDPSAVDKTIKDIQDALPSCEVTRTEQITKQFESQLSYIDKFIWIISLAALIVGCIGVLNTLLMSVTERTREIGTLRAIGWSRSRVVSMIVREALIMSFFGGLVGGIMGVVGAEWLIRLVPHGLLGVSYSLDIFARGIGVAVVMGFIGSIYPAYRASLLQPAEALRYE